ncbi:hypothetical protein [Clostridium thermarum]|uniref:hypothetical protein n=1 Tax=Clostridium thermarum TaxID=1716543 RepID=UPI00111E9035|nr:hypothetical protein [Clostridium thermarum]
MVIQEHDEFYCRAEVIDNNGGKQVIRQGILIDLSDDDMEVHLINLNTEQKNTMRNIILKGFIYYSQQ